MADGSKGPTLESEATALGAYNVWYHRTSGMTRAQRMERDRPHPRAWEKILPLLARTRADEVADAGGVAYVCLDFAHGRCSLGAKCSKLHRPPSDRDEANYTLDAVHDCFGRARQAAYKDDMGGIGTFSDDNRTLYVGRVPAPELFPPSDRVPGEDGVDTLPRREPERTLAEVFGLWGSIVSLRFIQDRAIAFVQYRNRSSAEFAKEALHDQAIFDLGISGDEAETDDAGRRLNLRWAIETEAIKRARRRDRERQVAAAVRATVDSRVLALEKPLAGAKRANAQSAGETSGAGSGYRLEYARGGKKARTEAGDATGAVGPFAHDDGSADRERREQEVEDAAVGFYPNTDDQYETTTAPQDAAQPQDGAAGKPSRGASSAGAASPSPAGAGAPGASAGAAGASSKSSAGGLASLANYGSDSDESS